MHAFLPDLDGLTSVAPGTSWLVLRSQNKHGAHRCIMVLVAGSEGMVFSGFSED